MLDYRVETFLCVCKNMNYTRAAEELHITQPAVSQQIRMLEQEYETKLFKYEGRQLKLTPAGEYLCKIMQTMKLDEAQLKKQLAEFGDVSPTLAFGVTRTIGEFAIAEPLSRWLKARPEWNFHVSCKNTRELLEMLRSGDIMFALVEGYFPEREYEAAVFKTVDFIPVCAADHVFPAEPHRLSDLFGERLLLREAGSGTRSILERGLALQNHSVTDFKSMVEFENMHTINQLVARDCGISFLYKTAVKDELKNGTIREIRLDDFSVSHDFTFIWNKNSIYEDRIRIFAENFKKLAADQM